MSNIQDIINTEAEKRHPIVEDSYGTDMSYETRQEFIEAATFGVSISEKIINELKEDNKKLTLDLLQSYKDNLKAQQTIMSLC